MSYLSIKKIVFLMTCILGTKSLIAHLPNNISYIQKDLSNIRLVVPEKSDSLANKLAILAETYSPFLTHSLQAKDWEQNTSFVFINSYNMESNGYVAPLPLHSVFFAGTIDLGGIDWWQALTVHELRHKVQILQEREGFLNRSLYYFSGGSINSLLSTFLYPLWLNEGDAVVTETALTKRGRGRVPFFTMNTRALELDNKHLDYYENYLELPNKPSFDNHYTLGYMLSSYLRKEYGKDKFNQFTRDIGDYVIFPSARFSAWIHYDKTTPELYEDAYQDYKYMWKQQLANRQLTSSKLQSPEKNSYESYYGLNHFNEKLLTLYFNKNELPSLGLVNKGHYTEITTLPSTIPIYLAAFAQKNFATSDSSFCYLQTTPNPRWTSEAEQSIRCFNLEDPKDRKIASGRFSKVSFLGKNKIVTIEYDYNMNPSLVILDPKGNIIQKITLPNHYTYSSIQSFNSHTIVFVILENANYSLVEFDLNSLQFNHVFTLKESTVRTPKKVIGGYFYQSDYDGIDNIFFFDSKTKRNYRVVSSRIGSFLPVISNKQLFYTEYTSHGYEIRSIQRDKLHMEPMDSILVQKVGLYQSVVNQEPPLDSILKQEQKVKDHHFTSTSFHPIWDGLLYGPWGFSLSSESMGGNLSISTLTGIASLESEYQYNLDQKEHLGNLDLNWNGWYPIFSLGVGRELLEDSNDSIQNNSSHSESTISNNYRSTITLPLTWFSGKETYFFSTSASVENRYIEHLKSSNEKQIEIEYQATYGWIQESPTNAIINRLGWNINTSFLHTPFVSDVDYKKWTALMSLNLPGIHSTDGFHVQSGYSWDNMPDDYTRTNTFDLEAKNTSYSFTKEKLNFLIANNTNQELYHSILYKTPISDLGFGLLGFSSLVYMNRLSFTLSGEVLYRWEDKAALQGFNQSNFQGSVGGDFIFTMNIMGNAVIKPDLHMGLGYLLHDKDAVFRCKMAFQL